MEMGFNEMKQLSELFNPKKNNSDSEDEIEECETDTTIAGAEDSEKKKTKINPYSKVDPNSNKEFVSEEEFLEIQNQQAEADWKKTPVWDITYKQQVTASDVFLQMGFKNPTSASCEDMIVTINLPGDDHHNLDLKIHKDNLVLVSPKHYLDLKLPHPVDPQQGNAKWDNDAQRLTITLRMDREFDFVNF